MRLTCLDGHLNITALRMTCERVSYTSLTKRVSIRYCRCISPFWPRFTFQVVSNILLFNLMGSFLKKAYNQELAKVGLSQWLNLRTRISSVSQNGKYLGLNKGIDLRLLVGVSPFSVHKKMRLFWFKGNVNRK